MFTCSIDSIKFSELNEMKMETLANETGPKTTNEKFAQSSFFFHRTMSAFKRVRALSALYM